MVIGLYLFFQSGMINSFILSGPKLISIFGEGDMVGRLNPKGLLLKAFLFGVFYFLIKQIASLTGI